MNSIKFFTKSMLICLLLMFANDSFAETAKQKAARLEKEKKEKEDCNKPKEQANKKAQNPICTDKGRTRKSDTGTREGMRKSLSGSGNF